MAYVDCYSEQQKKMTQQFLARFSKIQSVFKKEKQCTAKERLKYKCYLFIIFLLISELVLLVKTQSLDKGNSINNLSIIE